MQTDSFKEFVIDQLSRLGQVECRAMFGGHGLYHNDGIFGIIFKGRLYFKTCKLTLPQYTDKGMKPFSPNAKQTLKNYYEVPADILEDSERLSAWALEAEASRPAREK